MGYTWWITWLKWIRPTGQAFKASYAEIVNQLTILEDFDR